MEQDAVKTNRPPRDSGPRGVVDCQEGRLQRETASLTILPDWSKVTLA
jgi:hypothetical protein